MTDLYIKNIENEIVIKTKKDIVINNNGIQIFNPTEEMLINDGWEIYIPSSSSLDEIKENKKKEILFYDSSESVNIFYINGLPVWLDKATRGGLKLRFEAEIGMGKIDTILWYNNMQFPLPLKDAIQMLYIIELYASACYDNTQKHIAMVENLDNIDDVDNYDYTTGYPEKLRF